MPYMAILWWNFRHGQGKANGAGIKNQCMGVRQRAYIVILLGEKEGYHTSKGQIE